MDRVIDVPNPQYNQKACQFGYIGSPYGEEKYSHKHDDDEKKIGDIEINGHLLQIVMENLSEVRIFIDDEQDELKTENKSQILECIERIENREEMMNGDNRVYERAIKKDPIIENTQYPKLFREKVRYILNDSIQHGVSAC